MTQIRIRGSHEAAAADLIEYRGVEGAIERLERVRREGRIDPFDYAAVRRHIRKIATR